MRVLGLDPGSRRTGFGVVESAGNRLHCVAFGQWAPPARQDLPRRLHTLARHAGALIEEHRPDCVVIEEAFYHESVRSTLVLGHVRGALLVAAVEREVTIAEYSPCEIKLSVAENGGASKEQVAGMVRRLLALRAAPQADAADALAAAICHLHRSRLAPPARALTAAARGLEALLAARGRR